MAEKIGFVGLGIMGKPMVRNLVAAGWEVVVHNRSRGAVDELAGESDLVTAANSPLEVAQQTSMVVTMLPDSPDVEAVVFGENGLLEGMGNGDLLVDMSTIAPATSIAVNKALMERGASALDAPVSGGDKGAIAGTLSIMVGGTEKDFQRAHPMFEVVGSTIVHCGEVGAGQIVKCCNQVVVAVAYEAVSEALVLGSKAGVDPEKIIQVLNGGLAATRVLEMRGPTMIEHNFAPGFRINLHRKDLGIALATGKENNVPLPVTAVVTEMYESLVAHGDGDLDHSAMLKYVERAANHEVSKKS
ncbi:MAG: 2-hydroxy-3-oxopropionate reductase [Sphaerobacteraceae bacterium]|nr:MAG: 2-hydroxy-3-oxopropionate reductase [Sphaerobacteraceae bacterium]